MLPSYVRQAGLHAGSKHRCTKGEEGAPYLKNFENFGHKNAIKHENRGPTRFSHNPMYPLNRI
jgi:hypothetical protein